MPRSGASRADSPPRCCRLWRTVVEMVRRARVSHPVNRCFSQILAQVWQAGLWNLFSSTACPLSGIGRETEPV